MSDQPRDRTLNEVEEDQAELKKNIEASKELIARSDKLIARHREESAAEERSGEQQD